MDDEERPLDPTKDWVREHLHRYVATDGTNGHEWRGAPTLLLTTRGRRSGNLRRTPLIYGRSGQDYVVVGSQGGRPRHPGWFHNLVAESEVTVQVMGDEIPARARVAEGEERRAPVGPDGGDLAGLRRLPGAHDAGDPGRGPRDGGAVAAAARGPGRPPSASHAPTRPSRAPATASTPTPPSSTAASASAASTPPGASPPPTTTSARRPASCWSPRWTAAPSAARR